MNGKELLEFAIQNEGITTKINREKEMNLINYLHLGVDWNDERYINIRGTVISNNGEIIQRGYQKFFNHNELIEREDMLSETKKLSEWQEGIDFYVTEKIDGSYIKLSNYKGELIVTSSSSFNGEHVVAVKRYLRHNLNPEQTKFLYELGEKYTLLLEYVSPEYNLTVPYSSENLLLHGLINTATGLGLAMSDVKPTAKELGFDSVKILNIENVEQLIEKQKSVTDSEGWVVSFYNGIKLKFKTDWFFVNHEKNSIFFGRAKTKNNAKNIYDMYVSGELDDFISVCTNKNKIDLVNFSVDTIKSSQIFDNCVKDIKKNLDNYLISETNRARVLDLYKDSFNRMLAFIIIDERDLSSAKEKYVLGDILT